MLLVCQILNICNYQVLFWFNFIKKWSLTNVTHIWEIMYMTCLTIYFTISFCLLKGRHSEAAHEKRLLCAQKCTRGGVGWVGHEGVG